MVRIVIVASLALTATFTPAVASATTSPPTVTTYDLHRAGSGYDDELDYVDDAGHLAGQGQTSCVRFMPLPTVTWCDHVLRWPPATTTAQDLNPAGVLYSTVTDQNSAGTILGSTYSGGAQTSAVWKAGASTPTLLPSTFTGVALDDAGDVAGNSYDSTTGVAGPAIWHPNGTVTKLAKTGTVQDIDPTGHYVAVNDEYPNPDGSYHDKATIYHDGHAVALPLPSTKWQGRWVAQVNRNGLVVGSIVTPTSLATLGTDHIATWQVHSDNTATVTDWGTLTKGGSADGCGLDDAGQIIGVDQASGHSVIGTAGTLTDLGTLGGSYSTANAIDALGRVVGTSTVAGDGRDHAFFWWHGRMTDLTPAATEANAYGLNASGLVVGYQQSGTGPEHATAWQVKGG
jgi:probable HAF family extracellular repeat protein